MYMYMIVHPLPPSLQDVETQLDEINSVREKLQDSEVNLKKELHDVKSELSQVRDERDRLRSDRERIEKELAVKSEQITKQEKVGMYTCMYMYVLTCMYAATCTCRYKTSICAHNYVHYTYMYNVRDIIAFDVSSCVGHWKARSHQAVPGDQGS